MNHAIDALNYSTKSLKDLTTKELIELYESTATNLQYMQKLHEDLAIENIKLAKKLHQMNLKKQAKKLNKEVVKFYKGE